MQRNSFTLPPSAARVTLEVVSDGGKELINALYLATHCAMRSAGLASGTKRARRLAVRNAGLEVMQRFHVIERSRGGVPVPLPECEGIS